mmetsp:Transcript_55192/g.118625  ORF Transcript_55192/g.118625 Transcript_55192/m.118625 type:complete len:220 (-) Transcript_55192:466-1125(-)
MPGGRCGATCRPGCHGHELPDERPPPPQPLPPFGFQRCRCRRHRIGAPRHRNDRHRAFVAPLWGEPRQRGLANCGHARRLLHLIAARHDRGSILDVPHRLALAAASGHNSLRPTGRHVCPLGFAESTHCGSSPRRLDACSLVHAHQQLRRPHPQARGAPLHILGSFCASDERRRWQSRSNPGFARLHRAPLPLRMPRRRHGRRGWWRSSSLQRILHQGR